MADAATLKDEGNKLFQNGEFLKSAATYTQAIKLDPENHVLYSNRSAALLKLKKVTKALEDAEKCIALKPDWDKGYFRKGQALEEAEKMGEALEVYQHALSLNAANKELAVKIRTLQKLVRQSHNAKEKAEKEPEAPSPRKSKPAAAAAAPAASQAEAGGEEVVYEDMGSEEVAKFTEEFLGELAVEIRENGTDFIPTVHILPGPNAGEYDEGQAHIRGAGAFENPQTLEGFVSFLRAGAEKLDAQAVLTIAPKPAIGFPRTWTKPKWAFGGADGVFAQLESREVLRLWFIPVEGRALGTPKSISAVDFGPMPRILKK